MVVDQGAAEPTREVGLLKTSPVLSIALLFGVSNKPKSETVYISCIEFFYYFFLAKQVLPSLLVVIAVFEN